MDLFGIVLSVPHRALSSGFPSLDITSSAALPSQGTGLLKLLRSCWDDGDGDAAAVGVVVEAMEFLSEELTHGAPFMLMSCPLPSFPLLNLVAIHISYFTLAPLLLTQIFLHLCRISPL